MKWQDLMRVGTFKDRFGKAYDITIDKLNTIAKNFDPVRATNFCVGHPNKAIYPSVGTAKALRVVGDKLQFQPANVLAEFSGLVKKGVFSTVSAGLDAGLTKLDHIAFLSAERPAIDGLNPITQFSAMNETETVSLDISQSFDKAEFCSNDYWFANRLSGIGDVLRNLKNQFIEDKGVEKAEALIPEYGISQLQSQPPVCGCDDDATENSNAMFSSPSQGAPMNELEKKLADFQTKYDVLKSEYEPKVAEFSAAQIELASLKAENSELKTKVAAYDAKERKAEFSAFVEQLVTERKVLPGKKDEFVATLEALHAGTPAEFSTEGGAVSPVETFKATLKTLPVVAPELGEKMTGAEFSAPSIAGGKSVGERAKEIREASGYTLSVEDAIAQAKLGK